MHSPPTTRTVDVRVHYATAEHSAVPDGLGRVFLEVTTEEGLKACTASVHFSRNRAVFASWTKLSVPTTSSTLKFTLCPGLGQSQRWRFTRKIGELAGPYGLLVLKENLDNQDEWKMEKLRLRFGSHELMRSPQLNRLGAPEGKVQGKEMESRIFLYLEYRVVYLAAGKCKLPEVALSRPLQKAAHIYAHGAFMGAALSLMSDPKWVSILRKLEAEAASTAARLAALGKTKKKLKVMTILENSPVLAAYGLVRSHCTLKGELLKPSPSRGPVVYEALKPNTGADVVVEKEHPVELRCGQVPTSTQMTLGAPSTWGGSFRRSSLDADRQNFALPPSRPLFRSFSATVIPEDEEVGSSLDPEEPDENVPSNAFLQAPLPMPSFIMREPSYNINDDTLGHLNLEEIQQQDVEPTWVGVLQAHTNQRVEEAPKHVLGHLQGPNAYGYHPTALEWDLWLSPRRPWDLAAASVDHGTPLQLVQQVVATKVGLTTCARSLGAAQLQTSQVSPVTWLKAFGEALNLAHNQDVNVPLEVDVPEDQLDWTLQLNVNQLEVSGLPSDDMCEAHYKVVVRVINNLHSVPAETLKGLATDSTGSLSWVSNRSLPDSEGSQEEPGEGGQGESRHARLSRLQWWPLDQNLSETDLVVDLYYKRKCVGSACLHLRDVPEQVWSLEPISISASLKPRVNTSRKRSNNGRQSRQGSTTPRQTSMEDEPGGQVQVVVHDPGQSTGVDDEDFIVNEPAETASVSDVDSDVDGRSVHGGPIVTALRGVRVSVQVAFQKVHVVEAYEKVLGLPRAVGQTCVAMLSPPGGLFLDVKSAYSKPKELEMFIAQLAGLGVTVKAVCSFDPGQLVFPSRDRRSAPRPSWDTILFFHGLNCLEAACMRLAPGDSQDEARLPKALKRGQAVMFNGGSFLTEDIDEMFSPSGSDKDCHLDLICQQSWSRYCALVDTYRLFGGIYVQEPDTSAAQIDALVELVNSHPSYLPLGFAYGHIRNKAWSAFDLVGTGFGAQALVEERYAQEKLSRQTRERILAGKYLRTSRHVLLAAARRVLSGSFGYMRLKEQSTLLFLLGDREGDVVKIVDELGGLELLFKKFFKHYDHHSPLTLWEQGFNLNYCKAFMRLLRNKGALAAYPLERKVQLALFFLGRQFYGQNLWIFQYSQIRYSLHKLCKEALTCLLESCNQYEYEVVVRELKGRDELHKRLAGWLQASWSYWQRILHVEEVHREDPQALAYLRDGYGYTVFSREQGLGQEWTRNPRHTRNKHLLIKSGKALRKGGCCLFTVAYNFFLSHFTLHVWSCFWLPRLLRPYMCGKLWFAILLGAVLVISVCVALKEHTII